MNVFRAMSFAWQAMAAVLLVVTLALPRGASGSAAAQTTALPKTAAAAPASTAVFHEIDLDPNAAQWQQVGTVLGRLGLPNATDVLQNHMMEHGAARSDVTQADFDALLGGELAIVISPAAIAQHMAAMHQQAGELGATPVVATTSGAHGVAAVLLPGDPDSAWSVVQKHLTALAAKRNVSLDESTSNGADVIWVPPAPNGDAKQMDDHDWMGMHNMHGMQANAGFAVAHAGDFIIAAPTRDDLTDIIDTITSGSGSLADDANAQQVRGELPADALSFTYVDGPAIVDAVDPQIIAEAASMNPGVAPEAWRVNAGVALGADVNGFRVDTIEIPGQGGSLQAAIPQNDTTATTAAGHAPADTFAFEAGVLPQGAFAEAPFLLAEAINHATNPNQTMNENHAAPTQAEMDAAIAQATQTLGFNPRTELFDLLGGNFVAFTSLPDILHGDFVPDAVAAVNTTDPATLAATTQKLSTLIDRTQQDVDVTTRQIGSDTIYAVSAVANATNQEIQIPAFDIGVIGQQLVTGLGNGIEHMVNAPTSSLADEAQFKAVMDLLPSEHYQVSYVDLRQIVDPLTQLASTIESRVTPGATAAAPSATPATSSTGLQNLRALGSASFRRGDMAGSSMIIYIPEPGS